MVSLVARVAVRGPASSLQGKGSPGDKFLCVCGLAFRVGTFLGFISLVMRHEPFKLCPALLAAVFKKRHGRLHGGASPYP